MNAVEYTTLAMGIATASIRATTLSAHVFRQQHTMRILHVKEWGWDSAM